MPLQAVQDDAQKRESRVMADTTKGEKATQEKKTGEREHASEENGGGKRLYKASEKRENNFWRLLAKTRPHAAIGHHQLSS